jgi:hypothetical protein
LSVLSIEQITPKDERGVQIPIPKPDGHGSCVPFTIPFPEDCTLKEVTLHRTGISFFVEARIHPDPRGQRYEQRTFVFLPNGYQIPKEGDKYWRHVKTFLVDRYGDYVVHLYELPLKVKR